jgi:hypothetical protein
MKPLLVALALTLAPVGIGPAHHHGRYCQDEYDCDGGGSDGNKYEGGRSGDNDQRGDHNCRNFCFYGVPLPGSGDRPPGEERP